MPIFVPELKIQFCSLEFPPNALSFSIYCRLIRCKHEAGRSHDTVGTAEIFCKHTLQERVKSAVVKCITQLFVLV